MGAFDQLSRGVGDGEPVLMQTYVLCVVHARLEGCRWTSPSRRPRTRSTTRSTGTLLAGRAHGHRNLKLMHVVSRPMVVPDPLLRDTAKALFPNVRQVNCYELYTLHLGVVPAKTVLAQNKRLVKKLRETRGPRPSGGLPRFGV